MIGRALALLLVAGAAATSGQTWRGLTVEPENRCSAYDRSKDYRYYATRIRPRILAGEGAQPAAESPYSGVPFSSGGYWHVEHVVAISEAHDSGMCRQDRYKRRDFARDMRNLTLARASVNIQKSDKDAAEWLPDKNRCWYAETIVAVKTAYGLTVDQAEADALDAVFLECEAPAPPPPPKPVVAAPPKPACPPPMPEGGFNQTNWRPWRAAYQACQSQAAQARAEARARERARIAALLQPPARAWRIGRWIGWEAPATGTAPSRYEIETPRASIHDGALPGRTAREYNGRLAGDEPMRVRAVYGGQGGAYSAWLHPTPGDPPYLVGRVRYWATERWHGRKHVERWRRALAGMGVVECTLGHASRPPVCPLEPAMTAAEAEVMERRYSKRRWAPVVRVLRRLEEARERSQQ